MMNKKQRVAILSVFNQDITNSRKLRDTQDPKLIQHFTDKANHYVKVWQPSRNPEHPITTDDVLSQLRFID